MGNGLMVFLPINFPRLSEKIAIDVCVCFDRRTKFILTTMEILKTMISNLLFEYY